jgi:kinesin family protein C2/C3
MKDSLGGNSKTLMFVNISPADYNSQESQFSLQFGDKVKMIQNDISKNVESDQMNKIKMENDQLKKRLSII